MAHGSRLTAHGSRLVTAGGALLDRILDDTYPIWGEGLTRSAYERWNRAQADTPWGRGHLSRMALVRGDELLASAKRYDFTARGGGRTAGVLGIGAVFTPVAQRGHGYARALIERLHDDAAARGCAWSLLFSEIGARYYSTLGYHLVPVDDLLIEVRRRPGAPAALVRAGDARDLDAIAEITARYAAPASFALERTPDMIAFGIARRRLLAGLGPAGLRQFEFFVTEEGGRAVAYVMISRGPHGNVLQDCGDRDPTGARIGAMLQVLDARTPAEAPLRLTGWLPPALRPAQLDVRIGQPARELMMLRPLAADLTVPTGPPTSYWPLDLF